MQPIQRDQTQDQSWTPFYSKWRHGGWYVSNLRYPSGACGCVSNNYPDGKWRIVCDRRRTDLGKEGDFIFETRDGAARAEFDLVQNIIAEQALQAALQDGYLTWGGSPVTGPHLPHGLSEASQVEVIFRNGQRHTGSAQAFGWNHSGYNPHAQIVAYRVVDTTAHSHFAG
ncbi:MULTISPECIES: hypothetical protein [Pseudomonas]|jgi:hypothetical protein|uniref:Uncharacterized protein n=1 Tax=Pseudomonas aeruginosa TaxID=287 RepID=A0A1V0M647_PSEAI|nr:MULTISPECIES: hypothetical protein [Pseudomonas]WQN30200.1 hypothetical protein ULE26_21780 [Stutzerimonas stutzeri]AGL46195.1 hypothetical protein pOZ176_231 [Pseudomonas aeruginosa PA96]ARD70369.1 Hypothetical protein [Pseudomonas aeruginosa]AVE21321.1 Hypothetical protein [Pseudomonas aeruginosa]EIU1446834.1 hypothetical protein [Pseudomonas aeruginosa]